MNEERFTLGLKTRREVLGAEHVDESMKNADEFSADLQRFVTEACWGDVWNRPGLDRRTRSLLVLATLAALNRQNELRVHVRGALRNGASMDEIREVFMQCAVYCGAPAALDAFRTARDVLEQYRAC